MKNKLTKAFAIILVVLMVVTAIPVYAGSADSMNCDEAKASKVLPTNNTKGYWTPSYSEPSMGTVLGTWSPRSNYVRWLQQCLNYLGYNCGVVDGWYGNNTKNAVQSFQRNCGLVVDGVFGFNTHLAIRRLAFGLDDVKYCYVTARNGLNVRVSPNTSSRILGALSYGSYVEVTYYTRDSNGYWGKIDYNGNIGWICMDYVTIVY